MHVCVNGVFLEAMFNCAFRRLNANRTTVDELNVFPVPDGDTGINMTMTLQGGIENHTSTTHAGELLSTFASGMLFSARGNSGVIFSQFIRGFADGVRGLPELTVAEFGLGLRCGADRAYSSVAKPVEGTMLTVMRMAADFVLSNSAELISFEDMFERLLPEMRRALELTPSMLPVLAEAGVVDSGGAGLLYAFEGMGAALSLSEGSFAADAEITKVKNPLPSTAVKLLTDNGSQDYGYCTEFILQLTYADSRGEGFSLKTMINELEALGDSIVAVQDGNIVKIHVHTFTPEKALEYAHGFGEFLSLKIENMALQHNETISKKASAPKRKKYAVAAVASGKGIAEYFSGIGADVIINGGQTDNPSIEEFVSAFDTLSAEHIIVLPNNSNVVMAARQAAELYDRCNVRVVPTKSIAEGYSALSMLNVTAETVDALIEEMSYGLPNVLSAFVTTATRDTSMNGVEIKKGDYIGLDGDMILSSSKSRDEAVLQMLRKIETVEDKEVLTAFFGEAVSADEAEQLKELIEDEFPLLECGFIEGKQPVYDFIFAIE